MIEVHQQHGGYVLTHGQLRIPFQIDFADRNQLTIHVHPEMRLEVLAPKGRNLDRVLKRVDARSTWIAKQWHYFEKFQPTLPDRQYISGETHLYLGRQYRLKVLKNKEPSVKLIGRYLRVSLPNRDDNQAVERMVSNWYRDHAINLFQKRLSRCVSEIQSLGLTKAPKLSVRRMKRRWGSCTPKGNISLNVDLVKAPIHCIEYVIVHELCHLKIHNHSPDFYRLLSQCLPDWEKRKERLDSFRLE